MTDVATVGVLDGAAADAVAGAAEMVACDAIGDFAPDAEGLGTDETIRPSGEVAAAGVDTKDSLRVVDDAPIDLGATGAPTVDAAVTGATIGAAADATDDLVIAADAFVGTPAEESVDSRGMAPAAG